MNDAQTYRRPHYPRIEAGELRGREGHPYKANADLLAAANAALALQMPLLLTGEAGCGKTDFAYAVANALAAGTDVDPEHAELLECYVRSDSRAQDLLYQYDALSRFGDAHHGGEAGRARAAEVRNYLELRPLGRALMSTRRRVVLVDEIDKAPRDLPNDLLRELDQGRFEIPEIPATSPASGDELDPEDPRTFRNQMWRPEGAPRPMIVITSNVERQLPDPFLRRCVFFHIPFPDRDSLRDIVLARFPGLAMLDHALAIFSTLRAMPNLTKRPTTSELIDWLQVLATVFDEAHVRRRFEPFPSGDALAPRPADLPWKDLPGLGCLVKLREDLATLGAAPHHGA